MVPSYLQLVKLIVSVLYLSDMYGKVVFQKILEGDADVELPAPVKACTHWSSRKKSAV